jgi:glycosyltransferase involved in cell wall biosynthesis
MRICIVYDCLYPYTVGGAERWYRNLSLRLAEEGHDVTYLTLRQWDPGHDPAGPVHVRAVGPALELYADGRRRVGPPIRFGLGVLWHLLRHRRRYDVVHTASFPYFSLLAAGLVRPLGGYTLVVDWHEVWTREYWREYLGPGLGRIGWWVQKRCARIPQRAFCFSQLHAARLRAIGVRGEVVVLEGQFDELPPARPAASPEPVVVFAGRHIPEKRPGAVVAAIAAARRTIPELRGEIYGAGPEHERVLQLIAEHGLADAVEAPGFVEESRVEAALGRALCLLLPSRREGYGLVLLEAMARGTPVIVVAGADNASVELVAEGRNGLIAPSSSPDDLAAAIVRVHADGETLRVSTASWFAENAERLSLRRSLDEVSRSYGRA